MLARHRHAPDQRGRRRRNSSGFTLVEMLVAMVLTLIMVWAIAEFYARVGEAVRDGRAMIEQRSGMRTANQRLTDDLSLLTVVPAPPVSDALTPGFAVEGYGYLDIFEGPCSDVDPDGNFVIDTDGDGEPDIVEDGNGNSIPDLIEAMVPGLLGDVDDYIGFTMRSGVEPFVAPSVRPVPYAMASDDTGIIQLNPAGAPVIITGSSMVAEVAWWTSFRDDPILPNLGLADLAEVRSLHRRLLLVRPDLNEIHEGDTDYSGPYFVRIPGTNVMEAYYSLLQFCDVSVRPIITGSSTHVYFFANSLADLTRRENRFMHVQGPTSFPNPLDLNPNKGGNSSLPRSTSPDNDFAQFRWILGGSRRGEDVILSNVLSFDVRVFDPTAALLGNNVLAANVTGTLQPGDPGYSVAVTNSYPIAGYGAYVDLWYSRYSLGGSTFSGPPLSVGNAAQRATYAATLGAVYDAWATSYERDGLNQDYLADGAANIITGPFDEGTDSLDNDAFNAVDDKGEQETSPPYPTRLRGLEVKLRTYDPGTRQVQQGTVGTDFIPE